VPECNVAMNMYNLYDTDLFFHVHKLFNLLQYLAIQNSPPLFPFKFGEIDDWHIEVEVTFFLIK